MERAISDPSTASTSTPHYERPLVAMSQSAQQYSIRAMALEQRSAFEALLGDLLTMELEGEAQWLKDHENDENMKKEKHRVIDLKALNSTRRVLSLAVCQSSIQATEMKNLERRIRALQGVVRLLPIGLGVCYLLTVTVKLFNVISQEDSQGLQKLADDTARNISAVKVAFASLDKEYIVLTTGRRYLPC